MLLIPNMQKHTHTLKKHPLHHILLILISLAPLTANAGMLLKLYQQALDTNPALLGKTYAIDRATAQEDQAFSKLLPQVSAIGSYSLNRFNQQAGTSQQTRGTQTGTFYYDGLRGTVQARQALFDLPSYLRYKSAQEATQQTEQELEAYRMELAGEVLDRYLQVLEASDQVTYITSEKEATTSQINQLREMVQRQMATITDLYEAEAYYQTLNTQEIEAQNEKAVGLERLRELTGISLDAVAPMSKEQLPPVPENLDKWVQDAIHNNPNLAALQHAIESASKQISGAKAEHLPKLDLQLVETYSDQGYDNRQLGPYDVSSANLQLTIPIYEGGRVDASTREAAARYQMAKQQYNEVRRKIERETRTSFMNAAASHARIASTGQEVEAQNKSYEAQQTGYDLGVSTIVDVLNNRRLLYKANIERLKARYDYNRNLISLRIWAGGLTVADIEDIDAWFIPVSSEQAPQDISRKPKGNPPDFSDEK